MEKAFTFSTFSSQGMICNKIAGACSSARCLLKSVTLTRSGANGFHMSSPLQHDPTLKKKKKLLLDPKLVRKREKQEAKRRLEPILVPMDPDSVAGMEICSRCFLYTMLSSSSVPLRHFFYRLIYHNRPFPKTYVTFSLLKLKRIQYCLSFRSSTL